MGKLLSFFVAFLISQLVIIQRTSSKTGTWTLDPDPEKPGPRKDGLWKIWTLKTWTLKNLDSKNLDPEKLGKQADVEKWLEDQIV